MVEIPDNIEGIFYSQAIITDFDFSGTNDTITGIFSDYIPTSFEIEQTPIEIKPFELALQNDTYEICEDSIIKINPLADIDLTDFTQFQYNWSNGTNDSVAIFENEGIYSVTISLGCNVDSASFNILESQINVDLGQDLEIYYGDSVGITPEINSLSSIENYAWQIVNPNTLLSCHTCSVTTITPLQNEIISLNIINENGCTSSDDLKIKVLKDIHFPNIFSPNNDGVNDIFYIQSKNPIKINSFQIFNRWGSLVFDLKDLRSNFPEDGWDGTVNGKKQDQGQYTFWAEIEYNKNDKEILSGGFLLLK